MVVKGIQIADCENKVKSKSEFEFVQRVRAVHVDHVGLEQFIILLLLFISQSSKAKEKAKFLLCKVDH